MSAVLDLWRGLTGTVLPFAGSTAPAGWLLCDGSAASRATYANLFGVIGTTYGVGDGSTTFGLPDLRGRVIAGRDDMGGTNARRLNTTANVTTTNGSTTVSYASLAGLFTVGMRVVGAGIPEGTTIAAISTSAFELTLSAAATATASGVAMRFGFLDGITLGAAGGAQNHVLLPKEMPVHTHTATAAAPSTLVAGTTFVRNTNTTSAQIQTDSAGGDQSHPNVQPTFIMNHIIRV